MRGLKLLSNIDNVRECKSHLLQMRGLKRYDALNMPEYLGVASFTDAWIETSYLKTKEYETVVASFTDAWIETGTGGASLLNAGSHLLQMRGLKRYQRE